MRPLLLMCLLALVVAVGCGDDDDGTRDARSPGRGDIRIEFAMVGIPGDPFYNRLYHVDSPRRRIDVYDFDAAAGTIADRRAVIPVDAGLCHHRRARSRARAAGGRTVRVPAGRHRPARDSFRRVALARNPSADRTPLGPKAPGS